MTFNSKEFLNLSPGEQFKYLCEHLKQTNRIPWYDTAQKVTHKNCPNNHGQLSRYDHARMFVTTWHNIFVNHFEPLAPLDPHISGQDFFGYSQQQVQEPNVITLGIEFILSNIPGGDSGKINENRLNDLKAKLLKYIKEVSPGLLVGLVAHDTAVSHSLYLIAPVNLQFTSQWQVFVDSLNHGKLQAELAAFGFDNDFMEPATKGLKDLLTLGNIEHLSPNNQIVNGLNLGGNQIALAIGLYEVLINMTRQIIEGPTSADIKSFTDEAIALHAQALEIELPDSIKEYKKAYQHAIFAAEMLTELYFAIDDKGSKDTAKEEAKDAARKGALKIYQYISDLKIGETGEKSNFKDLADKRIIEFKKTSLLEPAILLQQYNRRLVRKNSSDTSSTSSDEQSHGSQSTVSTVSTTSSCSKKDSAGH